MKTLRYELVLEAAQAIAHHQDTYGNTAVAMRRKVRQPDGTFTHVPVVTGDTMRHGLREAAAYALLDAAGLLDHADLSEAALRLLFAGGMITGSAGGAVKLGDYRELVDLVPPLALLGGCCQNRSIPGRLIVDDALLICEETRHLVPPHVLAWVAETQGSDRLESCRSHVEEVTRVRMDPCLTPSKRLLLSAGARAKAEGRLLANEAAGEEGDRVAQDREKSTMMPRSFETVAQGSLFWWAVEAQCWGDLDEESFHVMLAAFLARARVGGKRATGHGAIRPVHGFDCRVHRPADDLTAIDVTALGHRVGVLFQQHVRSRTEKLARFLREVEA